MSCGWWHISLFLVAKSEWVVLLDTCPWLWCLNQSGFWGHLSLPLAMMSESELVLSPSTVWESKLFCEHLSLFVVSELEKFFRRHVLICCVWFRVVFQETCPYLLCLNQSCFCRHKSLFVVSESELFLRTPVLIFNVHLRTFMRRFLSLFSSPNCVTVLDFHTTVTYKDVS